MKPVIVRICRRVVELDPGFVAGAVAIGRREYEKAIVHLERAIEIDPDAYWPAGMVVQAYEALGHQESIIRSRAARSVFS